MDKSIVLKPRLSEKSYGLSRSNVYVFDVDGDVNKHSVARAVTAQFDVEVIKVNIANIDGKAARVVSKGGRRVSKGHRNDIKKAYVTLAKDSSLPFFDAAEEADAAEVKATEKAAKKAEKADKKEKK
ncbi:MAG: 50S ribosomal protein L23 [Candidatus Saccharimonadales bacterium]